MEHHLQDSLPDLKMLDYQVNYANHPGFSRKRKLGSPIRIFSNLPLKLFNLSDQPGYKFCIKCDFWVGQWNRHCDECKACTSKSGTTYAHCSECNRCVKPSYKHCLKCKRCCLQNHICGQFEPDTSCYHCHLPGHKKSRCPSLEDSFRSKRKKGQRKN